MATEFVRKLQLKGWSAKNTAERWGIEPRQLSRIAREPRQLHRDALEGLPVKAQEQRETGENNE
jgi:hypothetical protein